MESLGIKSFNDFYRFSIEKREEFWSFVVDRLKILFETRPSCCIKEVDSKRGEYEYLSEARLNISNSCFDFPDKGAKAIVFQKENSVELETWSFGDLEAWTNRVASALRSDTFPVKLVTGDAIAIDMPMTAESIAIYLGIVKAGFAVVSIADSFSAHEINVRLHAASAKAIFTQDVILRGSKTLPLYERVVEAEAPLAIVLSAAGDPAARSDIGLRSGDLSWGEFLKGSSVEFDAVIVPSYFNSNILFSSGTTSTPKAISWSHSTPIKAAMDGHFHHNIQSSDIVSWPTNLGWMMGPWLIYASLVNKAAIALFYGSPTTPEFVQFLQDAKVTVLGLVPSIVKAWRSLNLSPCLESIRLFSSTGEVSDPRDMLWLMSRVPGYAPVIEYCGGTEIGGGYVTGTVEQAQCPSCFSTPALGHDFKLLDHEGAIVETTGEVALTPPSLGLSVKLLNKDHYREYFEGMPYGFRRHGDQIRQIDGYFKAQGRVDDAMNLGGIKISSAELENACNLVRGVSESAAIAYDPPEGGPSQLVVYVVPAKDLKFNQDDLKKAMQLSIKKQLNPLFHISDVVSTATLPRTASNKIMRRVLRAWYASEKEQ